MAASVHPNGLLMNRFLILAMIVSAPFAGCNTPGPMDFEPVSLNVNARYIVESVHVNAPESPEIAIPFARNSTAASGRNWTIRRSKNSRSAFSGSCTPPTSRSRSREARNRTT